MDDVNNGIIEIPAAEKLTEKPPITASQASHLRWDKLSAEERSKVVPRNGGRHKVYPRCLNHKYHRFNRHGICSCGFLKPVPEPVETVPELVETPDDEQKNSPN